MTTLLKNASYLKVSHSGQTTGSLLLADLADEENAKQEKKIPVYVPEGGSITLPLDEDVLLSYQQGTIRGLEDQGYVSTTLLAEPSLKPERWVSPDGDDSNPGTREAPLASIQKAVDDLFEKHGHVPRKKVYLKKGEYLQSVIINMANMSLIAANQGNPFDTRIEGDGTLPGLSITNLTQDAYKDFNAAGGVSYTSDIGTSTFTYTGADVGGDVVNDFPDDPDDFHMYTRIEGLRLTDVVLLGANDPNNVRPDIDFFNFRFADVQINGADFYSKNARGVYLDVSPFCDNFVLDNTVRAYFQSQGTYIEQWLTTNIIVRRDDTLDGITEGVTTISSEAIRDWPTSPISSYTGYYEQEVADLSTFNQDRDRRLWNDFNALLNTTIGFDNYVSRPKIECDGTLNLQDNAKVLSLASADVGVLVKDSPEEMNIDHLHCRGNATISNGATNVIRSGVIEGNLTVDGAANIDFTNLVVKGDVTLNSGAGTVTWSGGSYHGSLTDPDNKLGGAAAGSYLNV